MATQVQTIPSLTETTVCLQFTTGHPGQRRKVATAEVVADGIPTDPVHVSKSVLASPKLKAIIEHETTTRNYVRARALPSFLKAGIYLLPVTLVERVDAYLTERFAEREALIEAFLEDLPAIIESDRVALGPLFVESDYPSARRLRRAFVWEVRYLSFSTPGKLKEISAALFAREREKAEADLRAAVTDIKALLRVEFKGLVDHMVDRLTPEPDGKRKVFRDSLVGNVGEFLSLVDLRNVTDDAELKALAGKARALLEGVDPQLLRDEEGVREAVAGGFANIKATLDTLVDVAPDRAFDFGAAN